MPWVKERTTSRNRVPDDVMRAAIKTIQDDEIPIRIAAEKYDIKKSMLMRKLTESKKNQRKGNLSQIPDVFLIRYFHLNKKCT